MELGEKLRLTRLEAGLSQRALCGDEITRNMLSRIENGAARPSMKTLGCLAARLGKPVSYFLGEDTVCSPNQEIMTAVRQLFDGKDYAGAMRALAQYRAPDEIYDRERQLLEILVRLQHFFLIIKRNDTAHHLIGNLFLGDIGGVERAFRLAAF